MFLTEILKCNRNRLPALYRVCTKTGLVDDVTPRIFNRQVGTLKPKHTNALPLGDIFKNTNSLGNVPEIIKSHNLSVSKCIEFLQGSNPREYAAVLDEVSGKVLLEGVGTFYSVGINFSAIKSNIDTKKAKLYLLHGHFPIKTKSGVMTLPVSFQDFIVLNDTKLKKITALDKRGRYSTLEKTDDFVTLSDKTITKIKRKYMDELLEQSSLEKTEKIRELIKYVYQHPEAFAHKREIVKRVNLLQYEEGADAIIDGFWRKYAPQYGLKYTTDFNL